MVKNVNGDGWLGYMRLVKYSWNTYWTNLVIKVVKKF